MIPVAQSEARYFFYLENLPFSSKLWLPNRGPNRLLVRLGRIKVWLKEPQYFNSYFNSKK